MSVLVAARTSGQAVTRYPERLRNRAIVSRSMGSASISTMNGGTSDCGVADLDADIGRLGLRRIDGGLS